MNTDVEGERPIWFAAGFWSWAHSVLHPDTVAAITAHRRTLAMAAQAYRNHLQDIHHHQLNRKN